MRLIPLKLERSFRNGINLKTTYQICSGENLRFSQLEYESFFLVFVHLYVSHYHSFKKGGNLPRVPHTEELNVVLNLVVSFFSLWLSFAPSHNAALHWVWKKSREILIYLSKFELSVRWFLTRNGEWVWLRIGLVGTSLPPRCYSIITLLPTYCYPFATLLPSFRYLVATSLLS